MSLVTCTTLCVPTHSTVTVSGAQAVACVGDGGFVWYMIVFCDGVEVVAAEPEVQAVHTEF